MRLFIIGAGFSGRAIVRELSGEAEWAGGTTRSEAKCPDLAAAGLSPFMFDGTVLSDNLRDALSTVTHLVQSIAPDETGDPVLPLLGPDLKQAMPALQWICYLSTVGVYGNHDGAWVDEETEPKPASRRSVRRLEAENAWGATADRAGVPLAILRLAGIYGSGRNTFVNLENGTARRLIKPGQVFNRIHVDDIAGATALLARDRIDSIFNIADDEPAPPQDLVAYAAELMGVAPPPEIAFEEADLSPMARSFYGENKRVSNARIKAAGYQFRRPNYRDALGAMWRDGSWR